jgi:hypothetical protein
MEEKTIIVCPNKACEKVFAKPLTTLKIQEDSKEYYNACPYCLTEISIIEAESKNPQEKIATEDKLSKEEAGQKIEKVLDCKYYFGYLSEKEHKQQMPEECMVCRELIECMHKKPAT